MDEGECSGGCGWVPRLCHCEEEGPSGDLVALLYCRKKAESLLSPQMGSHVIETGTVTRFDPKLGLFGVRLNAPSKEEIAVSLFADGVYISETKKVPTVGDHVNVYFCRGRVEFVSLRTPDEENPFGNGSGRDDDMARFVKQLETFADLSLQSPGMQGAVSSRLASKGDEDKSK